MSRGKDEMILRQDQGSLMGYKCQKNGGRNTDKSPSSSLRTIETMSNAQTGV